MANPHTVSDSPPVRKPRIVHQPHYRPERDRRNSAAENQISFPYFPDDILEIVFSFLPIQYAVQIGAFSRKFKESWLYNRKFLFGRNFAQEWDQENLVALVNRVFDSHKGSKIQTFSLCVDPEGVESSIEKWVRICIGKGIEELELDFVQSYTLPFFFLGIQTLRYLKLRKCEIELPPVLNGLRLLHTLILRQLEFTQQQLETLLSHCNQLETLDLAILPKLRQVNISARHNKNFKVLRIACCFDLEGIYIDAPTLRSIFFSGVVLNIKFGQIMHLDEAFINFVPKTRGSYMQPSKLENLVNDLFQVGTLTTSCMLIEALTARYRDGIFREKQFCLYNLKELQLFIDEPSFCNPYDIALFLKSCPSLMELFIEINDCHFGGGSYWELHQKPVIEKLDHYFYLLKFVKLIGFNFQHYGVELVKLILKKAVCLDTLVLITPKYRRFRIPPQLITLYSQHFQCWKASPIAKIQFFEHFNDETIRASHPTYWI